MWTEEPRKQHGYLTGQFSETYSTFTETYGHIFAQDAGDIDQRDSIHSDRILITMIPALELSSYTASALGKIMVTQQSMILARDLGHRIGGTDEEALEVKSTQRRFLISTILMRLVLTTQSESPQWQRRYALSTLPC